MEDERVREKRAPKTDAAALAETGEQVRSVLGNPRFDKDGNPKTIEGTVRDARMVDETTLGLIVDTNDGLFECKVPLTDGAGAPTEEVAALHNRMDGTVTEPQSLLGERVWIRYQQKSEDVLAFPPTELQEWTRQSILYAPKQKDEPLFGLRAGIAVPFLLLNAIGVFAGMAVHPALALVGLGILVGSLWFIAAAAQQQGNASTLSAERIRRG